MNCVQRAENFLKFVETYYRFIIRNLLMLTDKEIRDNEKKIDNQKVESSATEPTPSIWYN